MMLKAFLRDRDGSVIPMLAIAAIPLFGFVGAAVDYSRASSVRTMMQAAADATTLLLAKTQASGAGLSQAATDYFKANFVDGTAQNLQVTASSGSGSVSLIATSSIKTTFLGVLGFSTIPLKVSSAAYSNADGLGCVLSLDGSASGATTGQGSTTVSLNGCSLYVNSSSSTALTVGGSARISAYSVGVVGGVSGTSNITTTQGVRTGMGPLTDPYADVSYPAFFGCTEQNFSAKNQVTIDPGVYCGGMQFNAGADVTFNPGVYYLDGGSLQVNGGAALQGTGVTLVFTSKNKNSWATAQVNGNATINLKAPTSGPLAGIVVFGDRSMPLNTSFKFNGGALQYFGGAIYLPKGAADFVGGAGTSTSCTQLIANTVSFSGNSAFAINCSGQGTRPFSPTVVKLTS